MRWLDAARARLRLLVPGAAESRMRQEVDLHLDLETERLVREQDLTPEEARRGARAAFGGVEQHKEALRDGRGLAWLGGFGLDLKLGARLLFKYPGLTVISTVALAVGIAIVAGFHAATDFFVRPSLPIPGQERVVGLWFQDTGTADLARHTLGDMLRWQDSLESVEHVGTFTLGDRVVSAPGGSTRLVRTARISASAFEALRVAPALGRTLVESDERPGSTPVVLLGFDLWRSAFAGSPAILGQPVRLGGVEHVVVGVMPDGFAFPIHEQLWTPLTVPAQGLAPGAGPDVELSFGRLAPGASLREADAEFQVIAARLAAGFPETYARLRPRVMTYARSYLASKEPELPVLMTTARVSIGIVLLIVAVNVGALVYARNVARVGEVAVRSALGASRGRIVLQMFAEALVLALLAVIGALAIMAWPLDLLGDVFQTDTAGDIPYWFRVGIDLDTALLMAVLGLGTAVVTGVLPAMKLTARLGSVLRRTQERTSSLRFGTTATAVVVSQVAISVALMTLGGAQLRTLFQDWDTFGEDGVPREEYLVADLRWDLAPSGFDGPGQEPRDLARRMDVQRALGERLAGTPDVRGVTFSASQGVMPFEMVGVPLLEGAPGRRWTFLSAIAPNFFGLFGKPVLAGRAFGVADLDPSGPAVAIVNEEFLRQRLRGGQPIGQQVRPIDARTGRPAGESLEIVGVVRDFLGFEITYQGPGWRPFPTVYVPMREPGGAARMTVHVGPDPSRAVGRIGRVAADLDPTLVLNQLEPLAERESVSHVFLLLYVFAVGVFVFAAVVLSTAGVYSMMSFTVSRRTREIGIRTALGASPRQVVRDVFSRAMRQLVGGAVLGLAVGVLASNVFAAAAFLDQGPGLPLTVTALILAMGTLACGRPMRRALRVQPTEALRDEA